MTPDGSRIVQVANFYGPRSGGLRTTVEALGRGYLAVGHDRVLIVPGAADRDQVTPSGRRITLRAPVVPGGGGYRVMVDWRRVAAVVADVGADRLEVSDKLTLWPLATWASRRGLPALLLSHERIGAILAPRLPPWAPLDWAAGRYNRRLAGVFGTIVATSSFSRAEWDAIAGANVVTVPLGVDLATFRPDGPVPVGRVVDLIWVGRLSKEKRPDLAVLALGELISAGVTARLTVVGAGPEANRLAALAHRLPVSFTGHLDDRRMLARLLARAHVALAPCPVEAFGLSVLEALACGTPVVCADQGAAPELVTNRCGMAAAPRPTAMAAAIAALLGRLQPEQARRAARRRAEQFPWSATVVAMLAAHRLPVPSQVAECG